MDRRREGDESESMWRTPCDMEQRVGPNNVGDSRGSSPDFPLTEGLRLRVE